MISCSLHRRYDCKEQDCIEYALKQELRSLCEFVGSLKDFMLTGPNELVFKAASASVLIACNRITNILEYFNGTVNLECLMKG